MQAVDLSSLVVRPIRPEEEETWDQLMSRHHYLGFNRLVGESLKYVALLHGQWVALVGWGTSALSCAPRDKWIGWSRDQQYRRLRFVVRLAVTTHGELEGATKATLGPCSVKLATVSNTLDSALNAVIRVRSSIILNHGQRSVEVSS